MDAAGKAVTKALSTLPNFKADSKVTASAKVCTCCDADGKGLKLDASAGFNISAKMSIPLVGGKVSDTFSQDGYDVEYEFALGCFFEPSFSITGTIQGKTDCHFKNPQACASMSVNADLQAICKVGGSVTFKQNGVTVGKQGAEISIAIKSGVSGSLSYCIGQGFNGQICVKPVSIEGGGEINFGNLKFALNLKKDLTPQFCYPSKTEAPKFAEIAQEADDEINAALQQLKASMPATPPPHQAPAPLNQNGGATLTGPALLAQNAALAKAVQLAKTAASSRPSSGPARQDASSGICADVKLQLDQDLVLTRNAFNATLDLNNLSSSVNLTNIQVLVNITDTNGEAANDLFGIADPVVSGITAVDGTGTLTANSSGSSSWILVPTRDAAPDGPTVYGVGGVLTYFQEGQSVVIPLFSAPITVYPDPALTVQYFNQRDVYADDPFTPQIEPSIPFVLGVLVNNHGKGTAHNLKIISSQPTIVDNEKGLLIDFKIIGSQVNKQPQTPSLTATFGDIGPGQDGLGLWFLTSTLQGQFLDYKATFQHIDDLGKTNLSLVDDVSIHELTHLVQAPGAFEDGLPDFLVNDIFDPDNLPDTLYLSDGSTNDVQVVLDASTDAPASAGHLAVQLTASMPNGWVYLDVPDPGNGQFILQRVVRSDNVEIYMNTNVWTTDRTFIGGGRRPIYENKLHLFDYNSTGTYTLHYVVPPAADTNPPSSSVTALPAASYPQFTVSWKGSDNPGGSGLAFFDVFVSVDGGPFTPWLQSTKLTSASYAGQLGHGYAFYSVATDVAGNRESAPLQPQAQTSVSLINSPPVISVAPSVTIDAGQTLSVGVTASDPDDDGLLFSIGPGAPAGAVVDPASGHLTWPTSLALGGTTNPISIIVTDNGQPPLSATGTVTVVVRQINVPPVLTPIANYTINEGTLLTITNSATDNNLPPPILTFSLGPGAPANASIDPATGLFQWRPGAGQSPSTNVISVIVRDNDTPSLSATQQFTVTVRSVLNEFVLGFGATNVLAGQTGSVSVMLLSSLDLTNITAILQVSAAWLTNLTLASASPETLAAGLQPLGADQYAVTLALNSALAQSAARVVAQLGFVSVPQPGSAFVPLAVSQPAGLRLNGQAADKPGAANGRVVVIGREPLLDALLATNGSRDLALYGQPGASYELQYSPNVADPNAWTNLMRVPLTNSLEIFHGLAAAGPATFYRAYEFTATQPILDVAPGNLLILYGVPWAAYELDYATSLNLPIQWNLLGRVPLTNSFQFVSGINSSNTSLYYQTRVLNADPPILELRLASQRLSLLTYGLAGTNYSLLYSTNLSASPAWSPLLNFTLTNSFQLLNNLGNTSPAAFYRLQRQ